MSDLPANSIILGDNLDVLPDLPDMSVDLIYVDPPFNTQKTRQHKQVAITRDEAAGDRTSFGGRRYRTTQTTGTKYVDSFDDYLGFLYPRLEEAHRLLKADGSFFLHIDYRESHYCKVALDELFGREQFMNEIVWAYDYGARSKTRWSPKHDTIFWYTKNCRQYTFNFEAMDRIPYMAPGLVTKQRAAAGKTPTDVWWHTIVSPTGTEKVGYPTQKPLGVLRRIVSVHSNPGDLLLDFFAGSGTLGVAASQLGRNYILVDSNPDAIKIMERRLSCDYPTPEHTTPPQMAIPLL